MVDVASNPSVYTSRIPADDYVADRYGRSVPRVSRDRVRWGPIIAGLFGTLSVLAVLSVLGLAVGLSTVDRYSNASDYGIGAGIWGAISALVAFAFGGWLAARSSARVDGGGNGLLQGAMVWMTTIGLLLYIVAGGVGTLFRATTDVATRTASSVASERLNTSGNNGANTGNTNNVGTGTANTSGANDPVTDVTRGANNVASNVQASMTPDNVERAAGNSAAAAWGTLISMLLGLAAAAGGGFLGSRDRTIDDDDDDARNVNTYATTPTVATTR